MQAVIVIGKNFGDEGKGLAVDFFAARSQRAGEKTVCVRHNGGAQAGHTVERPGKRMVFSQLSSASFRGADTYWADSFLPDLYKLSEEAARFAAAGEQLPHIYASPACRCTCIADVLVNMLLESSRGANRHGSCGMGINEAVQRSEVCPLYLGDVTGWDAETLGSALIQIRDAYLPERIKALGLDLNRAGEYGELLKSDRVYRNAAEQMARNAAHIELRETAYLMQYDTLLFEGAQGLLLDMYYTAYAPHLTTSRTGLTEPVRLLRALPEQIPAEAVYVTRTYVTRHGAGPLPLECPPESRSYGRHDATNQPNPWQGTLRAAPHGDAASFAEAVRGDLSENQYDGAVSLFLTHLNESDGCIVTQSGLIPAERYLAAAELRGLFSHVYRSDRPVNA